MPGVPTNSRGCGQLQSGWNLSNFLNSKVLLEHIPPHLYCLWLLFCWGRTEYSWWKQHDPSNLKFLLIRREKSRLVHNLIQSKYPWAKQGYGWGEWPVKKPRRTFINASCPMMTSHCCTCCVLVLLGRIILSVGESPSHLCVGNHSNNVLQPTDVKGQSEVSSNGIHPCCCINWSSILMLTVSPAWLPINGEAVHF